MLGSNASGSILFTEPKIFIDRRSTQEEETEELLHPIEGLGYKEKVSRRERGMYNMLRRMRY